MSCRLYRPTWLYLHFSQGSVVLFLPSVAYLRSPLPGAVHAFQSSHHKAGAECDYEQTRRLVLFTRAHIPDQCNVTKDFTGRARHAGSVVSL